ncbi:MAG: GNAT family N-acetyltransferase [Bacteroidales bacterium]
MIREAGLRDIEIIQSIARKTWPVTFREILSAHQIDYMMDMMYSNKSLTEQIEDEHHRFLLSFTEELRPSGSCRIDTGYLSYELNYNNSKKTKIHKIYILPEFQGYGFGKALIEEAGKIAISSGNMTLTLNVNRNNKAITFYKSLGFEISAEEDIEIGNGFLMEDYRMEKNL